MKIIAIDDERPALELMMETLKRLCPDDEIISFNEVRALREYEEKSDKTCRCRGFFIYLQAVFYKSI